MKTMINWFSIPCAKFDRAVKFYSTILDIEMMCDKDPGGNQIAFFFSPTDGIAGAINADPNLKPGSEGTRIYLNAEGILDDVLGGVGAAGGKVTLPRTEIPNWGWIGMIEDTEGNTVGFHSQS